MCPPHSRWWFQHTKALNPRPQARISLSPEPLAHPPTLDRTKTGRGDRFDRTDYFRLEACAPARLRGNGQSSLRFAAGPALRDAQLGSGRWSEGIESRAGGHERTCRAWVPVRYDGVPRRPPGCFCSPGGCGWVLLVLLLLLLRWCCPVSFAFVTSPLTSSRIRTSQSITQPCWR